MSLSLEESTICHMGKGLRYNNSGILSLRTPTFHSYLTVRRICPVPNYSTLNPYQVTNFGQSATEIVSRKQFQM